jgi:Integrase
MTRKLERLFNFQLIKLKPFHFQEILSELQKFNPNTQKPSSKKTLTDLKNVAKQIFNLAIQNRVVDYNPLSSVKVDTQVAPNKRRPLTPLEQNWVISTPHRAQTAAMIMMFAGLRRGELLALTWNDIDLENKTIAINKSVVFVDGKSLIKSGGKTVSSSRIIYCPKILIDYLKKESINKKYDELLCSKKDGKLMTDSSW